MTKFTPVGALILFWFIGIVIGDPGLWFPLGFLAMVVVAIIQKKRGASPP
ncbi:hypothetical protein [Sphingomonas desiccabilis]|nr:hypothetical protein [Sphingomonas desiccabilis]MBB3910586.1 hypothetical protein [Sphingomonas desiccabilis]